MRRAVDTNVLIYTHMPSLPSFERVRRYVMTQLGDADVTLIVTPLVLHEFVHVVTDPRRFEPPLTMSDALATARLYLGRSNVTCVGADEAVVIDAFDLSSSSSWVVNALRILCSSPRLLDMRCVS